jgi:hypothetical protein
LRLKLVRKNWTRLFPVQAKHGVSSAKYCGDFAQMPEHSQGKFYVKRALDGRVRIECPPLMLVPPEFAVRMAQALLKEAGVETVFASPGQTVIRPPRLA